MPVCLRPTIRSGLSASIRFWELLESFLFPSLYPGTVRAQYMFADLSCRCAVQCGHFLRHRRSGPVPVISLPSPTPMPFGFPPLIMEPRLGGLNRLGSLSLINSHPPLSSKYVVDTGFLTHCPVKVSQQPHNVVRISFPPVDEETEVPKG